MSIIFETCRRLATFVASYNAAYDTIYRYHFYIIEYARAYFLLYQSFFFFFLVSFSFVLKIPRLIQVKVDPKSRNAFETRACLSTLLLRGKFFFFYLCFAFHDSKVSNTFRERIDDREEISGSVLGQSFRNSLRCRFLHRAEGKANYLRNLHFSRVSVEHILKVTLLPISLSPSALVYERRKSNRGFLTGVFSLHFRFPLPLDTIIQRVHCC